MRPNVRSLTRRTAWPAGLRWQWSRRRCSRSAAWPGLWWTQSRPTKPPTSDPSPQRRRPGGRRRRHLTNTHLLNDRSKQWKPWGSSDLQHGHLLAVTEQAEGEGVFVVEAGADLAASERQRGDVALQVVPVLVQEQLVIFEAAPALTPAVVGQHVQVACQPESRRDLSLIDYQTPIKRPYRLNFHSPQVGTSSSADEVCSSVDGFFFPSPMILVIFFPAPFPTVPVLCSDFEFFFPFPDRHYTFRSQGLRKKIKKDVIMFIRGQENTEEAEEDSGGGKYKTFPFTDVITARPRTLSVWKRYAHTHTHCDILHYNPVGFTCSPSLPRSDQALAINNSLKPYGLTWRFFFSIFSILRSPLWYDVTTTMATALIE